MSEMHQLLGLDPRIERPNAYQIFGLEVLEGDETIIRGAIRDVIARLKQAKATTDPAAWAQVAKSVSKAQQILSDPKQKSSYDQRLRNTFDSVAVTQSQVASTAVSKPVATASVAAATHIGVEDPLQGWLPAGDPFAAFDMALALENLSDERLDDDDDEEGELVTDRDESISGTNPVVAASPVHAASASLAPVVPDVGFPAAVANVGSQAPRPRKRRKRGFPVAGTLMTLFVLGLFGGIAYAVKMLVDRENSRTVEVAQADPTASTTIVRTKENARPRDNVMGNLLPTTPQPQFVEVDAFPMGTGDGAMNADSMNGDSMSPGDTMTDEAMSPEPVVNNPPGEGAPATASPPEMAPPMDGPSEEMLAAADKAAAASRDAIRNHDWSNMMALAEKAFEAAQTEEQKASASARRRLVHYATEYQDAIDRSLDQLRIEGGTLQLNETLIAAVVEITPAKLILKVAGKVKEYERDSLPRPVTSVLAPKSLPANEALLAVFRGAWQCLQENAIEADFEDAIKQWERYRGQTDEADVEGLETEVKAIFR